MESTSLLAMFFSLLFQVPWMSVWTVCEEETGLSLYPLFIGWVGVRYPSLPEFSIHRCALAWSVNEHGDKRCLRPAPLTAQFSCPCQGKQGWQHPAQPAMLSECEGKGTLLPAVTWFCVLFFLYHHSGALQAVTFATLLSLQEAFPPVFWNSSKLKLFLKLTDKLIYILYVLCTCSDMLQSWKEPIWIREFVQIKREIKLLFLV